MKVITVHRITGPHLLLRTPGAAIWLSDATETELEIFTKRIHQLFEVLDWSAEVVVTPNDMGCSVAFSAPVDQLYVACSVLEWAVTKKELCESIVQEIRAEEEENHSLRELYQSCVVNDIPCTVDEDGFFVGYGRYSQEHSLTQLPKWNAFPPVLKIPVVGITGTNGKTTTTRMLASIARRAGFVVGMTSSDGVVIEGELVVEGDWTGAGAARKVLRDPKVDFAILETARGGLMRRGMVIHDVDIVGITNVSPDHFGSWGINSVRELQRAKLSIVYSLRQDGVLVLNQNDDDLIRLYQEEFAPRCSVELCFFSLEKKDNSFAYCDQGVLYVDDQEICLLTDIPLTIGGHAAYNIENALLASVLAYLQGMSIDDIRHGLCSLQANPTDSKGRSNIFSYHNSQVIVDFAHNQAGIRATVHLVQSMSPNRSFMILGQAGDRDEILLQGMAKEAAKLQCERYFIKHILKHNEDRSAEETASLLQRYLCAEGVKQEAILVCRDELEATKEALAMLAEGDVLLLLSHTHYEEVLCLLEEKS